MATTNTPRLRGYIGYYKLELWWSSFSEDEQQFILDTFKPGLSGSNVTLTTGTLSYSSESAGQFLSVLASWFKRKDLAHIGVKILEASKQYCEAPMEKHFWCTEYIETRYKQRAEDLRAIDDVIAVCQEMIEIAPKVAKEMKTLYGPPLPPSHKGFQQLITIYKKQKELAKAERLELQFNKVWR